MTFQFTYHVERDTEIAVLATFDVEEWDDGSVSLHFIESVPPLTPVEEESCIDAAGEAYEESLEPREPECDDDTCCN